MIEKHINHKKEAEIVYYRRSGAKDHLLRKITKVTDFDFIYNIVEDKYSKTKGRPSVVPVVLVKMVIIQHLFGIKSLRQTVKEVEVNANTRKRPISDLVIELP